MSLSREEMEQRVQALSAAIESARRGRGRGASYNHRGAYRASPYYHPYPTRAQAAYSGPNGLYRNRTLVFQNSSQQSASDNANEEAQPSSNDSTPSSAWVSKRDRHLQLINKSVYEKRAEELADSKESDSKVTSSPSRPRMPLHSSSQAKLSSRLNITAARSFTKPAPPIKRELCRNFCRSGNSYSATLAGRDHHRLSHGKSQPTNFSTGFCRKGPSCHYLHDPTKVAICKEFLSKGTCRNGSSCNLSHEPNSHRCPACIHFARGNCNNSQCRYAHIKVSPDAPVCSAFANLGYCEEGAKCPNRHEFECPQYSSTGSCSNPRCRLPHIDRAGQLRQSTNKDSSAPANVQSTLDPESDLALLNKALGDIQPQKSPTALERRASGSSSSSSGDHHATGGEGFTQQLNFVPLGVDDDDPEN